MSCYQPYFRGSPFFSVLSRCGFEEHGGIVDCIKTINMSGINELLVAQGGSAMSRPESLHDIEELLEFPPNVTAADLDSRFRDLCTVLQKARDTFSCQVEEEQENPFQELRLQLQKAKDRFHSRILAESGSKARSSPRDVNPFQELRNAFRMARKHFLPLLDQYISSGNHTGQDRAVSCAPLAVEISRANALDSSTIFNPDPTSKAHHTHHHPSEHEHTKSKSGIETGRAIPADSSRHGGAVKNTNPSKVRNLEELIMKELRRREAVWEEDFIGDDRVSQATESLSELDGDTFERLSSTTKDDCREGNCEEGGEDCVPPCAHIRSLSDRDEDSVCFVNGDTFVEGNDTPAAITPRLGAPKSPLVSDTAATTLPRQSRLGSPPNYSFDPV